MKLSFRQILASAAGAVIAALIASSFGVTGTIVGVAIGSMAATLGTTLVAQSIERGQKAVKQVVVRVPEGAGPTSTLLRRMGATGAAGGATSTVDGEAREPEATEVVGAVGEETTEMEPGGAFVDATERVEIPPAGVGADDDASGTEAAEPATVPLLPTQVLAGAGVVGVTGGTGVASAADARGEAGRRRFTWKAFAGTAAIVFVLALGFVTAVELIANRPNIFRPSSPASSPTSTTTSTPTSSTTSTSAPTSSSTSSSTTSTTAASNTTTSTATPNTTTTTNILKSSTTTTTAGP